MNNNLCNCPNTDPLSDIPVEDCPFDIEQVQKLIFQQQGHKFDTGAATSTDPTLKADWDALVTAEDKSKVVITPFVRNLIIEAGDFITTGGGDNTTLNGVEEIEGRNPAPITGMFKSLSPAQEKALKKIMCKPTVVYLVNGAGVIFGKKISDSQTSGFNVQSLGIKDRRNEGFGTKDSFDIQFSFPAGWSEDMAKIVPQDFNPLYDL